MRRSTLLIWLVLVAALTGGCDTETPTVVLYCSVDQEFAERVVREFEQRGDIRVEAKYDTELGKTTGLVRTIEAQRARPRADVLWSSEIFNTILLARQGLLDTYTPPSAADIPDRFKDGQGHWTAFGLRARVLAYSGETASREALPERWEDLDALPAELTVAMADPEFGTTRGHVAAIFALWGEARANKWLNTLKRNGLLLVSGNAHAVRVTARGEAALCLTDTDDVHVARANGHALEMIYPDMGDGGTLLIPNTVAIIKGGPNPATARMLVDFLASEQVERMLAGSVSGNIPVRPHLRSELGLALPPASALAYDKIADAMETTIPKARAILLGS